VWEKRTPVCESTLRPSPRERQPLASHTNPHKNAAVRAVMRERGRQRDRDAQEFGMKSQD